MKMASEELVEFHNKCTVPSRTSDIIHCLSMLKIFIYSRKRLLRNKKSNQLKSTKLDLPNTRKYKSIWRYSEVFPKELQLHYKINVKRIQNTIELVKEKTYTNNQEIDN